MKIFSTTDTISEVFPTPVVTMGNFDGVHFGHQSIFRRVKARAQQLGGTSIVLTFDPHPQRILFPDKEFFLINHIEEKIDIIRAIGIDVLICVAFTREFAVQNPKDFVRDFLVQTLHVREIYVGYNSRFGQKQQGTPELLSHWGEELGFRVTIVPPIIHNGVPVSSTKIRHLLRQGLIEEAAQLLNRQYAIDGKVVPGFQRGSTLIGVPTANIDVHHELIPKKGIYICQAVWENRMFPAVVNIGTNPTFQQDDRITVEVHILDFDQNLYGQQIKVIFLKRLRDEILFSHLQELVQQIQADIQTARAYFHDHASSCST
jgi:riboflavin kinase / FMN adenylyltransferase